MNRAGPSDGDIFWTLLNALVIFVAKKGLRVYYHRAKAEFVTIFGPSAMGQAPLKHMYRGNYVLYAPQREQEWDSICRSL